MKTNVFKAGAAATLLFALAFSGLQTADAQMGKPERRPEARPGQPRMMTPALRASSTIDLKALRASTTIMIRADKAEFQKEIQAMRDAFKKQLETRKADKNERKQKLDGKKREVVDAALKNIYTRLQHKLEKLMDIDARLNAKTADLKAKGVDTATTTTLLISAKTALAKAQIDVEATKALSAEQAATSTSKEILKNLVKTAEGSIKSAKDAYVKVGQSLAPVSARVRATTTASTTITTN